MTAPGATLAELLAHWASLKRSPRSRVRELVAFAPCRPGTLPPDMHPPPEDTAVGEVCLATDCGGRGDLWRFRLGEPFTGADPRLETAGLHALQVARTLALRELPVLARVEDSVAPTAHGCRHLAPLDDKAARQITGGSFGVMFLVAMVSRLERRPPDPTILASAELGDGGVLTKVDGLKGKLAVVHDWAPAVATFLVAESQIQVATEIAEALESERPRSTKLTVVGAKHVRDALPRFFGELAAAPPAELWPTVEDAERAAETLFQLTITNSNRLTTWGTLGRTGRQLEQRLTPDTEAHWKARVGGAIARRHAGQSEPLPVDVASGRRGRTIRARLTAQLLQSWTDADVTTDALLELAREARATLPDREDRCPADLEVLGAVGRALAASLRFDEARAVLRDVVESWRDEMEGHQAGRAACELLRVVGIAAPDAIDETGALCRGVVLGSGQASAIDSAFLLVALGRAQVQAGQPAEGVATLTSEPDPFWAPQPGHVRQSRLRWLAAGQRGLGDTAAAQATVARLERELAGNHGDRSQLTLALLDAHLADGGETAELVAALRTGEDGYDVRRIEAGLPERAPDGEVARRVAAWWRY